MPLKDFEQYIRQGELSKKDKAAAWQTAVGLQTVDGLTPSEYLYETAKKHIEGDITIDEVKSRIDCYYKSRAVRTEVEQERTEEADKVSARIAELLGVTLDQLAAVFGKSRSTVKRIVDAQKRKGMLDREGARKTGRWVLKTGE